MDFRMWVFRASGAYAVRGMGLGSRLLHDAQITYATGNPSEVSCGLSVQGLRFREALCFRLYSLGFRV